VRRLIRERNRFVKCGVRFDNTNKDEATFWTLMSDKAHVAQASGVSEWFTPVIYIDAAREVMGSIEIDPASTETGNKVVQASTYFTAKDDGRTKEWRGNVWMNPPYSQPLVGEFCDLFVEKYRGREIEQGCVLVNNATETGFFQNMLQKAQAACFVKGRVGFLDEHGKPGAPLQGQIVLYFGKNYEKFAEVFSKFGVVWYAKRKD